PFMGKNGVAEEGGPQYVSWLQVVHDRAHGNADLSAHFCRRAARLLGGHGVIGFVTAHVIAQGHTRASGLQVLLESGFRIAGAQTRRRWPGEADTTYSVVWLGVGVPS